MIVTISFQAADGKRDELVAKMQSILPDTKAFDGCRHITLTESTETPGLLMLLEDWESAGHYATYKAWRAESGTSVLAGDLVVHSSLVSSSFNALD